MDCSPVVGSERVRALAASSQQPTSSERAREGLSGKGIGMERQRQTFYICRISEIYESVSWYPNLHPLEALPGALTIHTHRYPKTMISSEDISDDPVSHTYPLLDRGAAERNARGKGRPLTLARLISQLRGSPSIASMGSSASRKHLCSELSGLLEGSRDLLRARGRPRLTTYRSKGQQFGF